MFARPGLCGIGIGRLGLVAASQPSLVAQALAILAKYGAAANLYLPGVGAINGITAGNWLDSAGTTSATVDNPVGLVVSAGKEVGPELFTGAYVTGPATTATYSGRVATVTFGGNMTVNWTNWLSIPKTGPATTGFTVAEFWAKWVSGGNLQAGRGYTATLAVSAGENGGIRKKYAVTAHSSTSVSGHGELSFGALVAGSVWEIEIISVRELPGAHLTQSTAANRPVLRRGLVNQLLASGDVSSSSWTAGKSAGATVGAWTTGPDGQQSARLVTYSTANEYLYQGFASYQATAGQSVTMAMVCNTASRAGGFGGGSPAGTDIFAAYSLGNGWWLQTIVRTFTVTTSANTLQSLPGSVFGLGVATVAYHRVGLFVGTVTAQKIIDAGGIPLTTTAPASSTSGPFAWQFDGSNDRFASTLTPGNAGFFCAGANFTDSGVLRTLLGAGAGSDASSGVWLARAASNALTLLVGNGTTRNSVSAAYPVATKAVASAGWDASNMFVGINGTETSGAKSVNCTSANTINVGMPTAMTNPMLGTISGGAIIMPTVLPTVTERATLRQFIASLSGVIM